MEVGSGSVSIVVDESFVSWFGCVCLELLTETSLRSCWGLLYTAQEFKPHGDLSFADIPSVVNLLKPVEIRSIRFTPLYWSGVPFLEVRLVICSLSMAKMIIRDALDVSNIEGKPALRAPVHLCGRTRELDTGVHTHTHIHTPTPPALPPHCHVQ